SRTFVYRQATTAQQALDQAFALDAGSPDDVLFYLLVEVCSLLKNQRDDLLAFAAQLDRDLADLAALESPGPPEMDTVDGQAHEPAQPEQGLADLGIAGDHHRQDEEGRAPDVEPAPDRLADRHEHHAAQHRQERCQGRLLAQP